MCEVRKASIDGVPPQRFALHCHDIRNNNGHTQFVQCAVFVVKEPANGYYLFHIIEMIPIRYGVPAAHTAEPSKGCCCVHVYWLYV